MPHTQDIVAKLWNLCNILKDDGITYHEYVTELTFLLFLKMAQEIGMEKGLPEGYRWKDLETKNEAEMLTFYRELLLHLGTKTEGRVQEIFQNANTSLSSLLKKCSF
jgi:type I restriction enzyme M protein